MSTEAVTKFLSRLAEDPALQDQARSLAKNAQDPVAAAVELGSKQGFQFTGAEFMEVVQLAQKARSGQVDDAELKRVAGGLLPNSTIGCGRWIPLFPAEYNFSTWKYQKF